MDKVKIVILERNSVGVDTPVDCFEELGEVTCYPNTTTAEEVRERTKDADIIVANKARLNEESLRESPDVKLICEFATGFDNCDLTYCNSRGIKVANVADYCTDMVAQHTFTLMLTLLQKLPHYDEYVKSGAYAAQDRFPILMSHLRSWPARPGASWAWDISAKRWRRLPLPSAAA